MLTAQLTTLRRQNEDLARRNKDLTESAAQSDRRAREWREAAVGHEVFLDRCRQRLLSVEPVTGAGFVMTTPPDQADRVRREVVTMIEVYLR